MNQEFLKALEAVEAGAAEMERLAHSLDQVIERVNQSRDAALALIPGIAAAVGARAQVRRAAQWAGEPSSGVGEDNQRRHAERGTGIGTAAAAEHRLAQAFGNGLRGGSVAETWGCEFSQPAGAFLKAAAEVAAQRSAGAQPDGQFLSIITAQCNRLRALTQEFTR